MNQHPAHQVFREQWATPSAPMLALEVASPFKYFLYYQTNHNQCLCILIHTFIFIDITIVLWDITNTNESCFSVKTECEVSIFHIKNLFHTTILLVSVPLTFRDF